MKKILIILGVFLFSTAIHAQQQLSYVYDAGGNRVSRTIVMSTRSAVATNHLESVFFEEMLAEKQVKIYPNPVQHELTIEIAGYESSFKGEYAIYNISGAMVTRGRLSGETTHVDVSRLFSGTYILHIMLKGERSVWKIIKQ